MQKPLNVCHLLTSLKVGGAERFVIDLSLEQIKMGKQVTIISFGSTNDELYPIAIKLGLNVQIFNKKWWSKNLIFFNLIKKHDVIHFHSPSILKVILLILPFTTSQVKIYTRHGEGSYSNWIWKITHCLTKPYISALTFVSSNGQKVFNSDYNWLSIPQMVIENGIPIYSDIGSQHKKNATLRVGSVGRMVKLKSQKDLIKAYSILPNSIKDNIEIHFIGDGECRSELETQVTQLNIKKSVKFHGFLSERQEITSLYDLLVVSSESEGLSIAILEAMAQKKPVIATNVGGNPQLVKANSTGELYDYGNVEQLANILRSYLKEPRKLLEHGVNAYNHVKSNFSLSKTAKEYDSLYKPH